MKSAGKTLSFTTAPLLLSVNCLIQMVLGIAPCLGASASGGASFREVRWLEADGPAVSTVGNTWGVPWARGTVPAQSSFALRGADGKTTPMQSWPIAFWPDGSLKWTAHAIPASVEVTGPLRKAGEVPVERKVSKELSDATGKPYPMNFLIGTEWTSVASAWLTEWERTGNTKYRDKLITGMKSIAALPHGWMSGGGGYDPATGQFFKRDDEFYLSPLGAAFGAFEVNAELLQLLDVPEYEKTWVEYCKYYNAAPEEQRKAFGRDFGTLSLTQMHSRLTAYAAWKTRDPELAKRAWAEFFEGRNGGMKVLPPPLTLTHLSGSIVLSPVDEFNVFTNVADGFGLSAIDCLALVHDQLPREVPN